MLRIWIVCLISLAACSGCATVVSLAAVGTALEVAGASATIGGEVYQLGKLDTAFNADPDHCRSAVLAAGEDLQLQLIRTRDHGEGEWDFKFQDDFNSKTEVTLEKRAGRLCRCRVDVGWFGSRPSAELFLRRMEVHLPRPSTMPAN